MITESFSVLATNNATTGNNPFQSFAQSQQAPVHSSLQSKNVRIHKRRTSIRLEREMWNALNEIAALETCSVHDLCGAVYDLKEPGASFTAALRVFLMEYYRSASRANNQVAKVQKQLKLNQTGI